MATKPPPRKPDVQGRRRALRRMLAPALAACVLMPIAAKADKPSSVLVLVVRMHGSPEKIEKTLVDPIGRVLIKLAGVKKINTSANENLSRFEVDFGALPSTAQIALVADAFAGVRADLPAAIDAPVITIEAPTLWY